MAIAIGPFIKGRWDQWWHVIALNRQVVLKDCYQPSHPPHPLILMADYFFFNHFSLSTACAEKALPQAKQ